MHEAEVSLQAAQEARQDLDAGADTTKIATAQAAVDKKRLAVSDAEAALAGTQLVAPFDGTILETNVSAGDQVTANTRDPDAGGPEDPAGGGIGGRDDDPAGERGAGCDHHV